MGMYQKISKPATILVIIALILMPVSNAEILSTSIKGQDNIEGFARENDNFLVNITAKLATGSAITKDKVLIGTSEFNACYLQSSLQNIYSCDYTAPTNNLQRTVHTFEIKLKNNTAVEDSRTVRLTIDNIPPTIERFYVTNTFGQASNRTSGKFGISYQITDSACTGCGSTCSGISTAKIKKGSEEIHQQLISQNNQCGLSFNSSAIFNLSTGEHVLCLNASDKFMQSATRCLSIAVDNSAPSLNLGSVQFFQGITLISRYDGIPIQGTLIANITDQEDLLLNSVKANLTGIGGGNEVQSSRCSIASQNLKTCEWDMTLSISSASSRQIIIYGADTVGNPFVGTSILALEFDNIPPTINDFKLLDSSNNTVDFINGPRQARLTANITDNGRLNFSSINADLSAISSGIGMRNPDVCSQVISRANSTNVTKCEWNLLINLQQSTSGNIIVKASDLLANTRTTQFPFTISIDSQAPTVSRIRSEIEFNNKFFINPFKNNTLKADILESGSGLENKQAFLDLSEINGQQHVRANSCNNNLCTWQNVETTPSGVGSGTTIREQATVTLNLSDDAGNLAIGNTTATLIIDWSKPRPRDFSYKCTRERNEFTQACVEGDLMNIELNVTDNLPITALGNFSSLVNGMNDIPGNCAFNSSTSPILTTCKWEVEGVDPASIVNRTIFFLLKDLSGNENLVNNTIPILTTSNITKPDFWQASSSRSPNAVDRQTVSLIQHRVFFHLFLTPKIGGDTQILSLKSNGCTGDTIFLDGGSEQRSFPQFYNNLGNDPRDPFYKFTLETANIPTSLRYNCSLSIISRIGTEVSQEETEEVMLDIPLFDLSVGELGTQVNKEIEDVTKKVKNTKWIEDIQNIINIANKICSLIGVWRTLVHGWATLNVAFEVIKGTQIGEAMNKETEIMNKYYHTNIITKMGEYCGYISCDRGLIWGEWYEKMIKEHREDIKYFQTINYNCKAAGETQYSKVQGLYGGFEGQLIPEQRKQLEEYNSLSTEQKAKLSKESEIQCGATIWPDSPKESIVLSAATGCIPGILYNLEKQRVIDCQYLLCLKQEVPKGLPLQACKTKQEYASCKYFYGQVFQVLPFAAFFQQLAEQIKIVFRNPVGLIFGVANFHCEAGGSNVQTSMCVWAKTIPELGRLIKLFTSFEQIFNFNVNDNVCKEALK